MTQLLGKKSLQFFILLVLVPFSMAQGGLNIAIQSTFTLSEQRWIQEAIDANGASVSIIKYDSPAELMAGVESGNIDVWFGDHISVPQMGAAGLLANYAELFGDDYGYGLEREPVGDLIHSNAYCPSIYGLNVGVNPCDYCAENPQDPMCWVLNEGVIDKLTVPFRSDIVLSDLLGDPPVIINGIPAWWSYRGLFYNPDLIDPDSFTELDSTEFANEIKDRWIIYAGGEVPFPWIEGEETLPFSVTTENLAEAEFSYINLNRALQSDLNLMPVPAELFQPELSIVGGFASPNTSNVEVVESFMSYFNYAGQQSVFEATGNFPTTAEALQEVAADLDMKEFLNYGYQGTLNLGTP